MPRHPASCRRRAVEERTGDGLVAILVVQEKTHRLARTKAVGQRDGHPQVFNPRHPPVLEQVGHTKIHHLSDQLLAFRRGVDVFVVTKTGADPQVGSRPYSGHQGIGFARHDMALSIKFQNLGPAGHELRSR